MKKLWQEFIRNLWAARCEALHGKYHRWVRVGHSMWAAIECSKCPLHRQCRIVARTDGGPV